jgi:signal transduction histidine kinase
VGGVRIVCGGRLERDLHDGAQQHLLALSYDIRLAGTAAHADGDTSTETALASAAIDTQAVLGELRDLAHGIYPAVLAEAGIGPALATIADTARLPVEILPAGSRRYPVPVEAAVYFCVAEAVDDAARRRAEHATVTIVDDGEWLVVTIEATGSGDTPPMVAVADRVGALGGRLSAEPGRVRAEIPCE